jgi:hypothetical protein
VIIQVFSITQRQYWRGLKNNDHRNASDDFTISKKHGDYKVKVMDNTKIDFHLMHYRSATSRLSEGTESRHEFARFDAIRGAALLAIALEASIIQEIGSGVLSDEDWNKAIAFIERYEKANMELAI